MDFTSPYNGGGAPSFTPNALAGVIEGQQRNTSSQLEASGRNMASLADILTQYSDKQKQLKTQASASRTFLKSDPDLMKAVGVSDPHELDNMSSQDVIGAATGVMQKQGYDKAKQEMADVAAQAQQRSAKAALDTADDQTVTRMAQGLDVPNDPLTGQPMTSDQTTAAAVAGMTPQQRALLHAVAGMGGANPRVAAAIAKPLLAQMATGKEDNTPSEVTLDDGTTVWGQKTTKNPWQVSPSSKSAAAIEVIQAKADAAPAKGGVTPHDQFNAMSALHRSYISNAAGATAMGKPDAAAMWQQKADETANDMNDLVSNKPKAAPAEAALPMPTDKTKMQTGKSYQTSRGVYTWDGKQFTK